MGNEHRSRVLALGLSAIALSATLSGCDFVRQVMGKIGLETREIGLNAMVERLKRAALRARQEGAAGAPA